MALALVLGLLPGVALAVPSFDPYDIEYAVTGGYLYFNKGSGTITGCDESVTEATIPEKIMGVKVTEIDDYAFEGCTNLTSITVDANNAAYCDEDGVLFNKSKTELFVYPSAKSAASYTIPDSVTTIKDNAFENCSNLTSVSIPVSVTHLGGGE